MNTWEKAYIRLNAVLFDDMLPDNVEIITFINGVQSMKKTGWDFYIDGVCFPQKGNYVIGLDAENDRMTNVLTLVHEMIHIFQLEQGMKGYHGKFFAKKSLECAEVLARKAKYVPILYFGIIGSSVSEKTMKKVFNEN